MSDIEVKEAVSPGMYWVSGASSDEVKTAARRLCARARYSLDQNHRGIDGGYLIFSEADAAEILRTVQAVHTGEDIRGPHQKQLDQLKYVQAEDFANWLGPVLLQFLARQTLEEEVWPLVMEYKESLLRGEQW